MELGQKLKDARAQASLSQEAVAKHVGVSRQTISNWENCRSYPDIGSLLKLSDLYGLSLDGMLKEDSATQSHYENITVKRRNLCQALFETGIILALAGWLLEGLDFPGFGIVLTACGIVLAYGAAGAHLRLFDHTRQEILRGALGLSLMILGGILVWWKPELGGNILFSLLRLGSIFLVWSAGVLTINWKSTRLWLIIALYFGTPLLTLGTHLQDTGSLEAASPFGREYRVAQVLYPEDTPAPETVKVDLRLIFSEHGLRIAENGMDYADIGTFTFNEPEGIWQLTPEAEPDSRYSVVVEEQSVILSHTKNDHLQFTWRLSPVDTASVIVSTFGKTMSTNPTWYPEGPDDPVPYFSKSDVLGKAKVTILVEGLKADTLALTEEYHHDGTVETQTYTLPRNKNGSFTLEVTTRYEGPEQYALYRIPFEGGEYRFTLTFG